MLSCSLGMPAEIGVLGLVEFLGDGSGSEVELSLASRDCISIVGVLLSSGRAWTFGKGDGGEPRESVLASRRRGSVGPFDGALDFLFSLVLRERELPAVTVCARVGIGGGSFASGVISLSGWGFLAWATARGPAHRGIIGSATLARTKLASTATGRTFSLIFSCRPESAMPKTMC